MISLLGDKPLLFLNLFHPTLATVTHDDSSLVRTWWLALERNNNCYNSIQGELVNMSKIAWVVVEWQLSHFYIARERWVCDKVCTARCSLQTAMHDRGESCHKRGRWLHCRGATKAPPPPIHVWLGPKAQPCNLFDRAILLWPLC